MKAAVSMAALLMLCACTTARPEPEIRIVETTVPVPISCVPADLPQPVYQVTMARIHEAPDAASRYALITAALAERIARLDVVEPVIAGCQ